MSLELVGFENLPNAFVKQIVLTDGDKDNYNITVDVVVKDVMIDGRFLWSQDELVSKYLRVGTIFVEDTNIINNLTTGAILPSDTSLNEHRQTRAISFAKSTKESMTEYHISFAYKVKSNTRDLAVFTYCFMDIKQVSQTLGLKLYTDGASYSGPIKSERILNNSSLVKQTNIFERPDGSLWAGPVHSHDGGYMVGSYHSDIPHDPLMLKKVANLKIKDKRGIIPAKDNVSRKSKTEISDLSVSYDDETNVSGIFSINTKSMLVNNTKYGAFLRKTSDSVLNEILRDFRFSLFMIERHRIITGISNTSAGFKTEKAISTFSKENIVKSHDTFSGLKANTRLQKKGIFDVTLEDLPSSTGIIPEKEQIYREDVDTYNKISEVKELTMAYGKHLRHFQFTDLELTPLTPGKYQYMLQIHFQDPVYRFIEKTVANIKLSLSEAKKYLGFISRPRNYDYSLNRAKFSQYDSYDINSLVQEYLKYYFYIYQYDDSKYEEMSLKLFSMLNPNDATISSVNLFVDMYSKLFKALMRVLDFNDEKLSDVSIRKSVANKVRTNRIVYEKKFSNIVEPSSNYRRLKYLQGPSSIGVRTFTKRQILERVQNETNKHFNAQPNFGVKENNFLTPQIKTSLNNIRNNSTKFLSPVSLGVDNKMINLERNENINFNVFNKALGTTRKIEKNNLLTIRKPDVVVEEEKQRFISSREIIGENHEFVSYEKVGASFNKFESESPAMSMVKQAYKQISRKTVKDFDLVANKVKLSEKEYLDLPMQIKAIMGRNLDSINGNFTENNKDMLASPETKEFVNVNNLNVVQVKYLDSFEMDEEGDMLLDKPIYKEMDLSNFSSINKPVLCSLNVYTNNKLKIEEDLKANIVGSTFIISDESLNAVGDITNNDVTVSYINRSQITYEYTSTNIIIQTNNNNFKSSQTNVVTSTNEATSNSQIDIVPVVSTNISIGSSY